MRTDFFTRKTLQGQWLCDTMNRRCKSMDGNQHSQVFANKAYFLKVYEMYLKRKAIYTLNMFCQDFGVPEKLTFDGSKDHQTLDRTHLKYIQPSFSNTFGKLFKSMLCLKIPGNTGCHPLICISW